MDVFVQYVAARLLHELRETSYRTYVARSLQLMPQGSYLSTSWSDAIKSMQTQETDVSADEVIDHVVARLESL